MALPTTNITMSAIANELGENRYDLAGLCKSPNINMYAKNKPTYGDWPLGANNKYSINIPVFHTENIQNWSYIKPSKEFRMGDFRGYNKNACPPIYVSPTNILEDTNIMEGNKEAIKISFSNGEMTRAQLGLNTYYCAAQLISESGDILYITSDKTIENNGHIIYLDFSQHPLIGKIYKGKATINLFLSSTKQTIPKAYLNGVKLAMPKGVVNNIEFINSFQMRIYEAPLCSITIKQINKNLSTSGWNNISLYGKGNSFKTKNSMAFKIVVKSNINRIVRGLKFKLSPTFFNDTLIYDMNNIIYDATSLQSINEITASPEGNTYIIYIQNCMNMKNGSGVYGVADGIQKIVSIILYQNDLLISNNMVNVISSSSNNNPIGGGATFDDKFKQK